MHRRFCKEIAGWYARALSDINLPLLVNDVDEAHRAASLRSLVMRRLCACYDTDRRRAAANLCGLNDILARYKFTPNERTPTTEDDDALDPELPGKVFEQLLARGHAQPGASARKQTGSFYTPREIVNYMVGETLIAYLAAQLHEGAQADDDLSAHLRDLCTNGACVPDAPAHKFSAQEAAQLVAALARVRILDPACGSGAFLLGMLQRLVCMLAKLDPHNVQWKRCQRARVRIAMRAAAQIAGNTTRARTLRMLRAQLAEIETICAHGEPDYARKFFLLQHCLYGIDIQPDAVRLARWRCHLALRADRRTGLMSKRAGKRPLPKLAPHIVVGDGLRGSRRRFDIVIGNPPYLGEKGHKELFRALAATPLGRRFYTGKMDMFYFFFHLGLDVLKDDGLLAFITTNYFTTATAAKTLRADLQARATVLRLLNFNEARLFASAHGQHNMITILRKGTDPTRIAQTYSTARKGFVSPSALATIISGRDPATEYFAVRQRELYAGAERCLVLRGTARGADADLLPAILAKMQTNGTPLGQLFHVNQGIVSGADKVSRKHAHTHALAAQTGTGIFVVPADYATQLKLSADEARVLKPWFKNSDIQRWTTATGTARRVLYFDRVARGGQKIIRDLERFRPILERRREVARGVIHWWQLQWPRAEKIFTAPKIVAPQRAGRNVFGYNEISWFASADVYFITDAEADPTRLKILLALLNSNLYLLWLAHRGKRKGALLELYQQPLAAVPVPHVPPEIALALVRRVERIIAALRGDPQADVRVLERQIDALVHQLFNLTPEEIRAVEAAYLR